MFRKTTWICISMSVTIIVTGALLARAGDLNPPAGKIQPTMHSLEEIYDLLSGFVACEPSPEDVRSYHSLGEGVLIAEVEGPSGFIITDLECIGCVLFEDKGNGPTAILSNDAVGHWNFNAGVPVNVGSVISVEGPAGEHTTVSGYVY